MARASKLANAIFRAASEPARKRRGPPQTGKGKQVVVRSQPPLMAAIDAWIAEQPDPRPTRAEALRQFAGKLVKVK
jgi:hypothetical protein